MSVLGICLGAQLLAKALGRNGRREIRVREIGWYDVELTPEGVSDPVLSTFAPSQRVFQWHEDGIELPPSCVHLARSPASEVQAFRHGEHAYGFPVSPGGRCAADRAVAYGAGESAAAAGRGRPVRPGGRARRDRESIDELMSLSNATFSRWVDRFEIQPRRRALPSR